MGDKFNTFDALNAVLGPVLGPVVDKNGAGK